MRFFNRTNGGQPVIEKGSAAMISIAALMVLAIPMAIKTSTNSK